MGRNSLREERQDPSRSISQRERKLIEPVFGWSQLTGLLRGVKPRGIQRVHRFYRLAIAGYDMVRMRRLIPIQAPAV